MPYNGSGSFSTVYNWQNDAAQGLNISSSRMQAQDQDFANGLSDCITRDGQSPPTHDLPMGGFHLTNMGNAAQQGNAVTVLDVQNGTTTALTSVTSTDTITATTVPAIGAYAAGQAFDFIPAGANATTAVTLNLNGLGAMPVTKNGTSALGIGDLQPLVSYRVRYDGTRFQIVSPLPTNNPAPTSQKIKNGNFDVWQRGTSFTNATNTTNAYTADCWQVFRLSFTAGYTASQVSGPVGTTWAMQIQRTAGDTSAAPITLGTSFETLNVRKWQGKTYNFNFASMGSGAFVGQAVTVTFNFGTGTDGNATSGPSGTTSSASQVFVLTNAYQTFNFAVPIPAIASQCMIGLSISPVGTAGSSDYVRYAQIAMSEGASLVPYEGPDVAQELFACKRYYRFVTEAAFYGYGAASQLMGYGVNFEDMRTVPSATIGTVSFSNASGLGIGAITSSSILLYATVSAAGSAAWDASGRIILNASL